MTDSTLQAVTQPENDITDPLHELLRQGARDLITKAVEAELTTFLEQYADKTLEDGRRAVVRNGHLPERTIQTGIGDVSVQVPKVRDRSGHGACFNSNLLPPYLKRTRSIEELIPWLYLKGISTGDYQEALAALLVQEAMALNPFDQALFVFGNRQRDKVKLLFWERNGFVVWYKRLERERFKWPTHLNGETVALTGQELNWLLDGYDLKAMKPHKALDFQRVG